MTGEHFDFSSDPNPHPSDGPDRSEAGKRFLGVTFACCGVYARVYINQAETAYEGRCPKCTRKVRFQIAPGGSGSRFFTAY